MSAPNTAQEAVLVKSKFDANQHREVKGCVECIVMFLLLQLTFLLALISQKGLL
jgi:hypothetical protein